MILIQRPILFILMCFATVFLIPFLFMGFRPLDPDTITVVGVMLLAAEVACYALWIALFTQFNAMILVITPVMLALLRFALALGGAFFVSLMNYGDASDALMNLWLGQPMAVLLQILVIVYLLPFFLAVLAPGVLIGTRFEGVMHSEAASQRRKSAPNPAAPSVASDIAPTGGVLQIYTLADIPKYFEKVAGLEGYAIYTSEGLLYHHDLEKDHQVEHLGVRLQQHLTGLQNMSGECGLEEPRRLALMSDNFTIFVAPITEHFWGVFIFNKNVSLDNCHNKLKVLVNSTKSFFKTRYLLS